MGLSHHAKNALAVSLGRRAATEVIPLLDMLAEEVAAEKARREARSKPRPAPEPSSPAGTAIANLADAPPESDPTAVAAKKLNEVLTPTAQPEPTAS